MARFKMVNGEKIQLTSEEETIKDEQEINFQNNAFPKALAELRLQRNNLLSVTDWWGASDNTMSAEQTKYRQDLRDITNGLTTLEEVEAVEFPTKPS
jgi:hypothetical protein